MVSAPSFGTVCQFRHGLSVSGGDVGSFGPILAGLGLKLTMT